MDTPPRPVVRAIAHGLGAIGVVGFAMLMMVALPDLKNAGGALILVGGIGLATWATMIRSASSHRVAANDNEPVPTSRSTWVLVDEAMSQRLMLPR